MQETWVQSLIREDLTCCGAAQPVYDEEITVNLSEIEPLAAMPHSPDNVLEVEKIGKIKVDQVAIGSCTNSSYADTSQSSDVPFVTQLILRWFAFWLRNLKICPYRSDFLRLGRRQAHSHRRWLCGSLCQKKTTINRG